MTLSGRGSVWRRWEPHIHAPGTVLADRYPSNKWPAYFSALEAADPPVRAIGVTDYCVVSSYERFLTERQRGNRLTRCDLVFPNIELRLDTGTVKGHFVNIHLLVCPDDTDHVAALKRFLAQLKFEAYEDTFSCVPDDLMRLGRRSVPAELDDHSALQTGCLQFKVSLRNLVEARQKMTWAAENVLIAVSGHADGTSGVRERADSTLRREIERAAHLIFASSPQQREFWLGEGKATVDELREFHGGPKPCIWGSDAHELKNVAKPADNRFCWLKGALSFDTLRQACIDPNRAVVDRVPPAWASPAEVIEQVEVTGATWLTSPTVPLNPGLVAIVGARGSGKTALADVIAAGCGAYEGADLQSSFLARAAEHLSGAEVTLRWLQGDPTKVSLDSPESASPYADSRARYLSQQFVEHLCSGDGTPLLLEEIERVVFEAHSSIERDGVANFQDLFDLRTRPFRDARASEEDGLASISDEISFELDKMRAVADLEKQVEAKKKSLVRLEADRQRLLPKKNDQTVTRLSELVSAAEKVRAYLRSFANRQASLSSLREEVTNLRERIAPQNLRSLKERHKALLIGEEDWESFRIRHSGDVKSLLDRMEDKIRKAADGWKGTPPSEPVGDGVSFLGPNADITKTPLTVLEAEINRLEMIVSADKATARKLAAITKRIADERVLLEKLQERLDDCSGAQQRAKSLSDQREIGYARVFDLIESEEDVLRKLYDPLGSKLAALGGTMARISFRVERTVDIDMWASRGEALFDLRGGPFKGTGTLAREARAVFERAWSSGTPADVSTAMQDFRMKHQDELLAKAPFQRSDQVNYRPWAKRFAKWLYSTDHIAIKYGIEFGGVDIQKLSPGTRGIVLVLMYLGIDDADERPLIIDQPEENLDPQSIHDELVPLFQSAKQRRQVIMVTHNANLVVNSDADQVIVAHVGTQPDRGLPSIRYDSGGLEESEIRRSVCAVLEGGERAFRDRARRLRIALER